jgi:phosphate transport system substrate-binding protein
MSQKNEITLMALAFLITAGLLGGALWWFFKSFQPMPFAGAPVVNSSAQSTYSSSDRPTTLALPNLPKGLISYGGSTTWAPIRREVDAEIQKVHPQFQLRYIDPLRGAPSSSTGIAMLLENQIEFAQSSRPITPEEYAQAEKRGFKLKEIPVAIDGPSAVVHPSLTVSGLTLAQYDDIFAGKLTNWNQVGGPNLKIQLYGKEGRDRGDRYILTRTTTEALRKIATDPRGIYWSSASLIVPQCGVKPLPLGRNAQTLVPPYQLPLVLANQCPDRRNQINIQAFRTGQYPLSRRLFVIIKQNGGFEEQVGEAYANLLLTAQGQELIAKAGFVSLR